MTDVKHDQHLLVNKEIAKKIAEAAGLNGKVVLEIGCGKGILTKELAKKAKVIGIELDTKFKKELEKIKNLELHFGNALEVLDFLDYNILIANIPYSISEPLFYKLLHAKCERAILMVSTKFYKHITSEETKLGILAKHLFNVKLLFEVPKENFNPVPAIDSVVLELEKKESNNLVQEILLQFDKKVENALREAMVRTFKITKKEAKAKIESLHLRKTEKRIRQLKKEELEELINASSSLA